VAAVGTIEQVSKTSNRPGPAAGKPVRHVSIFVAVPRCPDQPWLAQKMAPEIKIQMGGDHVRWTNLQKMRGSA
jgi:hypothetical protein